MYKEMVPECLGYNWSFLARCYMGLCIPCKVVCDDKDIDIFI